MEVKGDKSNYLLCMACLCVGRSLQTITDNKLKQYYLNTLREIPLCDMPQVVPNICWECEALLRKLLAFREQVKDSYRILQTYTNENLHEFLLSDVSRPPRLKIHNNDPISIKPIVNDLENIKEELEIKFDSDAIEIQQSEDVAQESGKAPEEDIVTVLCEKKNKHKTKHKRRKRQEELAHIMPEIEKCEGDQIESDGDSFHGDDVDAIASGNDDEIDIEIKLDGVEKKHSKRVIKDSVIVETRKEKRLKSTKKTDKKISKTSKIPQNQKILTVELSYEDILSERTQTAQSAAFTNAQYKCGSCLRAFKEKKELKEHNKNKHSPDLGEYICPICYIILSSVKNFKTHYKRHTRRFECAVCHKRTAEIKAMRKHLQTRHSSAFRQYKCNICGKISNSIDTHRYHKDSHKARVPCKDCDKTFSHRAGLMNHRLAIHESQNEFPCPECEKVFRWKTSLTRHLEKHQDKSADSAGSGKAYCSACDIAFSSVCSLQRHLRNSLKHVTHDQLKFCCDHCKSRFADKTKLRNHIEEKHLHRTYQCHICHKPSKNRVGLEQHIRNVHKGRPNNKICHHCGKGFPTKVQLESHIRSHTGERPFICEYCSTTFSQQSNLYKHHRQVHMNMKTKKYSICKKGKDTRNQTDDPAPVDHGLSVPIIQYMSDNIFGV